MPIKPAPMLAELRQIVLTRSEKRSPKWKFQLAPDLVVQIQGKLTLKLLKFEGRAIGCEGANLQTLLGKSAKIDRPHWTLGFRIEADTPDAWMLKPNSAGWGRTQDRSGIFNLRDRIIAAFREGRFDRLNPDILLGSHCLCCGKGLTDPVSQARKIGPECWGSASEQLPFVLRLADSQQAA
jgi:hypothetical protein